MRDDLLVQLQEWHEEDEFQEIVDAIQAIPVEERDYELVNHLGRALNNLEQYEEAVEQFLTVAKEGTGDPLWHYRIGLAYYYLEQYAHALQAFERADELDPEDEDTLEFLGWIRSKMEEPSESEPEVETDPEAVGEFHVPVDVVATFEAIPRPESGEFWNDSEQALEHYVSNPPSDGLIDSVEEQLVFRLPASYIEMMKLHNGGIPYNRYFPVANTDTGATDYVEIEGILGIGREKPRTLAGIQGSWNLIEREGYPEIGVVIAVSPSESGVVMLDYRSFGNDGEPEVVYVKRENPKEIIPLAPNFETFIQGLMTPEV